MLIILAPNSCHVFVPYIELIFCAYHLVFTHSPSQHAAFVLLLSFFSNNLIFGEIFTCFCMCCCSRVYHRHTVNEFLLIKPSTRRDINAGGWYLSCVSLLRSPSLNWCYSADRNIDGAPQPDWQLHESLLARWLDTPVGLGGSSIGCLW